MQYRRLGRSGLRVSPLCLGAMNFGERTDVATAARIVEAAREAGVNFIDTADSYAGGESERMVGRLIASRRDEWVLATKVGNAWPGDPNRGGLSRRWLLRSVEDSLARLRTDWIDILYLHRDDRETPQEETIHALGDLLRTGRIRYIGLSNLSTWRLLRFVRLCEQMGVPRPIVCSPYYNAMNRMAEVETIPACVDAGLGVVPYSPVARGVLSVRYLPGQPVPPDSRVAHNDRRILETEYRSESVAIAQQIAVHARVRGFEAPQFAVAWVLANRFVSSVLAGPRTLEHWEAYVRALDYPWSEEDEALVDRHVRAGHPSTPGYIDPKFPVEGRAAATRG
jgi:aryl-alcohol dehydrogenase (NADP+)